MTAHQDVAGVVEKLRGNPHGLIHVDTRAGINEPTDMIRDAATIIESLSKALSEAEAQADKYCEWWREKRNECMAAESRLAEAMRLLADLSAFQISDALNKTGKFADVCKAWIERKKPARDFLNAGKE